MYYEYELYSLKNSFGFYWITSCFVVRWGIIKKKLDSLGKSPAGSWIDTVLGVPTSYTKNTISSLIEKPAKTNSPAVFNINT